MSIFSALCAIRGGGALPLRADLQRHEDEVASQPEDAAPAPPARAVGGVKCRLLGASSGVDTSGLMAGFTSLRWGKLAGLRGDDVDLANGYVHVRRNLTQLDSGRLVEGSPKSAAGYRRVVLPPLLVDDLRAHLDEYVPDSHGWSALAGPYDDPGSGHPR